MKIVFFGTPEFAVESLDALRKAGHEIAAVVTMPDKTGGRGHHVIESDVKKYAVANGLPVLQPEKLRNPEFLEALRGFGADLFIVIAFRMLPEAVWAMPPLGTFNLHASLLPDFRGAAPINHALIEGRAESGVTTFMLTHGMDTGGILMQQSTPISDDDDAGTLHDRLMHIGADVVVRTVKGLEEGSLMPVPQDDSRATPAPKIFKHTCRIDFNRPTRKVFDFIRGHSPYPAAWAIVAEENGREFEAKIIKAAPASLPESAVPAAIAPADVFSHGGHMYVATADGLIEILEIQPAGKRRMDARAFLAGYHPVKFI